MRTLVAAILVATLIVVGVAIGVPVIARPIIVAAVQSASPFGDQPLQVDVDCNVFALLRGTVDRIRIRGTDLKRGDVTVGAVDVTLTGVATSGHAFAGATGTIASISVADVQLDAVVDDVQLSGTSADLSAVATLDRKAGILLIERALADAGGTASGIDLGAGSIGLNVLGIRTSVVMGVVDGAIVLVDPFGQGDFEVLRPSPQDGWTFTGIVVRQDGLTIDAKLDVEKVLASS